MKYFLKSQIPTTQFQIRNSRIQKFKSVKFLFFCRETRNLNLKKNGIQIPQFSNSKNSFEEKKEN